ncbi:hypothetical protein A2160_04500 [Candidatus Beckwithbacteria bacterium RBG_13_42_9]|uniref:Phosphoribosyltransferase domain-containing protein n=1 Tax=Candidatus Beckwithbacteria bacterium RBG_13_42_9 TaxID=1797457 RepID=A0A1F5E8N5_9BACT|nr:MAG: hypothetical protein A2160_04500 [Candidatus Beckwithbacteria bacterium RBG_13_42_9]
MELSDFEYISWEQFHKMCFDLAQRIKAKRVSLDKLAVISRGGAIVGRILSDLLDLPIHYLTIVSTVRVGHLKEPKIVEAWQEPIERENILLVDEIADSGRTFECARQHLLRFKPAKIYTAAPVIKPATNPKPDFYIHTTNKWIVFPYELRETIEEVTKIWQKEKVSKKEIAQRFVFLGFKQSLIKTLMS